MLIIPNYILDEAVKPVAKAYRFPKNLYEYEYKTVGNASNYEN
jgi:hypothetical protein